MDSEKSVLLLPFGLFTTQIPYVILGVMYLLYIGMAFLNRPVQSEDQDFTAQSNGSGKIEFTARTIGSDIPVIDICNHGVSYPCHFNEESDSEPTVSTINFCQYGKRMVVCEPLSPVFQSRHTSFSLFSRPPPVTA